MRLKKLVKESWLEEKKTLTKEERAQLLGKIKRFNEYGKTTFRASKLGDVAKELSEMCKMAEVLTLSEVDETFDKITVQRNMKELANLSKGFQKTSGEADILESRLKTLYDDMGRLLERYYEIDDNEESLSEELPSQHVEKGQGKKPYDNWHANDVGGNVDPKSIDEELPSQHVEKGQGKKPYDNWRSNDVGGQPAEPKQTIDEKKK
jgi:hypothetical protein